MSYNKNKAITIVKNIKDYYGLSDELCEKSLVNEFQYSPEEARQTIKKYYEELRIQNNDK